MTTTTTIAIISLTRVVSCKVRLAALADGPIAMLTLLDDWVSVVFPPSAAESPEMTKALEKLLFPNKRLSVELVEEARLDLSRALALSCTVSWPRVGMAGVWENTEVAELWKESWLPPSPWAIS